MKRLIPITATLIIVGVFALSVWHASTYAGGDTATVRQTKLYGDLVFFDDTLANAKVTISLSGKNYFYTSAAGSTIVCPGDQVVSSDANGYFWALVWGVDSLFPSGYATYTLTVEQPELQSGGIVFQASGLAINAAESTDVRDVLAQ